MTGTPICPDSEVPDGLGPARGIVVAAVASVVIWAVLIAAWVRR